MNDWPLCPKIRSYSRALCVKICLSQFMPLDAVFLLMGSTRDPHKTRTDAELMQALRRAWLLPQEGTVDASAETKFGLDAQVAEEGKCGDIYVCSVIDRDINCKPFQGSNFSAGERQLIALCRALVKGSKIIVLVSASTFCGIVPF